MPSTPPADAPGPHSLPSWDGRRGAHHWRCRWTRTQGQLCLEVRGALFDQAPESFLRRSLALIAELPAEQLTIDLRNCSGIASTGVSLLVRLFPPQIDSRYRLLLADGPESRRIWSVLDTLGLGDRFRVIGGEHR